MNDNPVPINRGLTSIIVPCWNEITFTQQCIAALKQHTRPRWELIVVDNGSTDGTGTYLAGVRDMSTVPVTVVSNAVNLGFPAAINQGLRLARGEFLVMLNNDVVVTDGWLDQLLALVKAKRGITAENAEIAEIKTEEERANGEEDGDASAPVDTGLIGDDAAVAEVKREDPAAAGAGPGLSNSGGFVPDSAESTAGPADVPVAEAAWPTPPGPPFARGGKVIVPPCDSLAEACVEEGDAGAATSRASGRRPPVPHRHGRAHVELRGAAAARGECALSGCRGNAHVCKAMARAAPWEMAHRAQAVWFLLAHGSRCL